MGGEGANKKMNPPQDNLRKNDLTKQMEAYNEGYIQAKAETLKKVLEMIDELLEESKRLKEYGWTDGVELKTNLQEKFK